MAYKLTYFDIPGRGEPIRLIFAAAGVKFVDNRISFADWPALKPTLEWGQMPVLHVGDKTLTQSKAIYRYLARKFKLAGEDDWDMARCDEIVDAFNDLLEEYVKFHFKESDPVKKEQMKQAFISTSLPKYLGKFNKIQLENGGTWMVGKNMTWADIVLADGMRQMSESVDADAIGGYPHLRKMQEAVFASPNIKAYEAARKK